MIDGLHQQRKHLRERRQMLIAQVPVLCLSYPLRQALQAFMSFITKCIIISWETKRPLTTMMSLLAFFVKRGRSHPLFVLLLLWHAAAVVLIDTIIVWWTRFFRGMKWRIISILPDRSDIKETMAALFRAEISSQAFKTTFQQFNTSTYRLPEQLLHSVEHILYLLVDLAVVQSNCRVTASSQCKQRQSLAEQPPSSAWHFYLHCFCYPSPAGLHLRSDPEFMSFVMSPPQKPLIIPFPRQNICFLWTMKYNNINFPVFTLRKARLGAFFPPFPSQL